MRIYDIIAKKKRGGELSPAEIKFVIEGFTAGEIPDYQMSALLMAICFVGMTAGETVALTMAMVDSGDTVDLSSIAGTTVDKHSTGGVGDKTTLAVMPIVAALGVPVAKMSGRGLGHTGGTVDKLEAIPGFKTNLTAEEMLGIVREHGLCVAGQSGDLAPADKKIYALRDVTATVESIPLIAASIMSKKIASGAARILLDIKTGSGAFMKNLDDAKQLARAMVDIGNGCGRQTAALITDMSAPLGREIGNSSETAEAAYYLMGKVSADDAVAGDFATICEELTVHILVLAGKGSREECLAQVRGVIADGTAHRKLCDMVAAQGGERALVYDPSTFPTAAHSHDILAPQGGYIAAVDTEKIGTAAVMLGAGREKHTDTIDYAAGITLHAKTGKSVKAGDKLATLFTGKADAIKNAEEKFLGAITFSNDEPPARTLVYDYIC
jgi:pyrimidine-nucleoside phosphorylase